MPRKTLRLLLWYIEHLENEVFLLFAGLAFLAGYLIHILMPLDSPWSLIVPVVLSALLYYYAKRRVKRKIYGLIKKSSKQFSEKPFFRSKTTEELIEAIDIEVLTAIREEGGDYFKFIPDLASTFDPDEFMMSLSKLTSLGKIKTYSNRISLTAEAMEILSTPPASLRQIVPKEVAGRMAKAKALMKSGNFNGVVDEVNKLFENVLRDAFRRKPRRNVSTFTCQRKGEGGEIE